MALAVITDGPALIRTGTGSAGALEDLGYTRNQVEVEEETFYYNVPGDQNGGDDGPPIEIQFLGQIHRVRLDLSKYDAAVVEKLRSGVRGTTGGTIGTVGTLMAASSSGFRVLISPTSRPRNYLFGIPRIPIFEGKGTKWSPFSITFECHAVSGTMFNTTTSG